ncbi:MAG: hypothetical protein IIU51_09185, partial [Bacteroidaceae bacterium]|nr:hypothetical protein [Bacteroidaceae bacterium]
MNRYETPVLLLTGYLGSGKTTLLNRILSNQDGIRFAVIVNDIGEVNIDASLIQKGGIVDQQDDSLIALQNGCICCTLKMDLVEQLHDIISMQRFDYIVIEASGICEPGPIAQTICSIPSMEPKYTEDGIPRIDCIATVVDALRMQSEFDCGEGLVRPGLNENDIENLVIQQIEFCNIVLLNKADLVSPSELERVSQIIRALQPHAEIIPCNFGDVPLEKIIHTGMFDFERVATSAAWISKIENYHGEEDGDEDEHEHHHHHHHHDGHHCHDEHCHCHPITEKGYSLVNGAGEMLPPVVADFAAGPAKPASYIGKVASLLYTRFQNGQLPIGMVSMDNCSHNGDKLYAAINAFAEKWAENGLVEKEFVEYINNREKVSFPWSMIDKITPRPDASVEAMLNEDGIDGLEPVITSKNTYVAPFVNAEECEYLVIEDWFPNGRPELEKGG